ncbi:MAG: restriction endonuclease [Steroidobacteraceae bacterium]|jgi:restriction system protein
MSRRDQFFEKLLAVASKLPWQAGVGLAVLSFLGLHFVSAAFEEPLVAADLADMRSNVGDEVAYFVAVFVQFLVPIGFLVAAGVSFVKRSHWIRLSDLPQDDTPTVVKAIRWRDFESLICEAFRREGYRVDGRGGSGPDGGIDLIATKAKKRILIQCKHWKTQQVGATVIRELHGLVTARRADGGVVITGGGFSREAKELARTCRIRLIDGDRLQHIIGSAQSSPSAASPPTVQAVAVQNRPAAPACPKCGAGMVDRVAKQGKFAGRHFWGCSQYPKCTGIARALESQEATRQNRSAAA